MLRSLEALFMRKLAVLGVLCGLPLAGQTVTEPTSCLNRVGSISYPPYEWGNESSRSVIATVRVGSNGSAEILSINGQSGGSEKAFEREVQKSIAASTFESKCSGQKLILSYMFELKGERGTARKIVITRSTPNRVIVAAQPPATVCDTAADGDDEAKVFLGRSEWLLDAKRFSEALDCAEASIRWKPTANAYIDKGVALRKLKRMQEAVAAYGEAEKLEPSNQHVHFDRANSYRDLGHLERAIQDYSAAIAVNTDFDKAYLNRGNIYLRLRRFDLALVDYSTAIELDPDEAYAYVNSCLVRNHLGDYQQAQQDCDKAIQIDRSDPSAFHNRAGVWFSLQKYDEALKDATEAIRLDPDYFEARYTRGLVYGLLKQLREAAADLYEAIRLRPESAEAYALRSMARNELGDLDGAKSDQDQALKLGKAGPMKWFTRDPVTGRSIPIL